MCSCLHVGSCWVQISEMRQITNFLVTYNGDSKYISCAVKPCIFFITMGRVTLLKAFFESWRIHNHTSILMVLVQIGSVKGTYDTPKIRYRITIATKEDKATKFTTTSNFRLLQLATRPSLL